MTDMVNNPPHYKDESGIECIEVTKYMQFCGGNCFKYLYRAGQKGDATEDLKKARWYAERAWFNEEVVCPEAMAKILDVAQHRGTHIKAAMEYITQDGWADAKRCIGREIDRLKSEGGK